MHEERACLLTMTTIPLPELHDPFPRRSFVRESIISDALTSRTLDRHKGSIAYELQQR